MPRIKPVVLNDTQQSILRFLSRVMFATADQIQYWVRVNKVSVFKATHILAQYQFIKLINGVKPYIIQITQRGARACGSTLPTGKSFFSWSSKTHRVYRNDAEILLRGIHTGFTMQSRQYHLAQGLNPSHGEHSGIDENNNRYFCLIDDYRMHPNRIMQSWNRKHTPNKHFFNSDNGFRWSDLSDSFILFSTNADELKRYQTFNDTQQNESLNLSYYYLKPRWKN